MMFTSIFASVSATSTFIPFDSFFFPLNTSEIPPANPPAVSTTPFTSDTATPAIIDTTSSDITMLLSSVTLISYTTLFSSFSIINYNPFIGF